MRLAVVLLLALGLSGCDSCTDNPTAPDPVTPTPTATPEPVAVEPVAVTPEKPIQISPRGIVDNATGETLWACMYCPPYGAGELYDEWKAKPGRTKPTWKNETCEPVKCQVDVIGDPSCPAKPFFQDFRDGRIIEIKGQQAGPWEEIPDTRFTRRTEWGECPASLDQLPPEKCYECREVKSSWKESNGCEERTQKTEETERREIPCECQDNPTGSVDYDSSGNPLSGSATLEDSGNWTLRISASSRESECTSNNPDYWKRTVRRTLECDERGTLEASYSWAGHGSEWWRVVLYRNDVLHDASECFRSPFN